MARIKISINGEAFTIELINGEGKSVETFTRTYYHGITAYMYVHMLKDVYDFEVISTTEYRKLKEKAYLEMF